jgi:hypothetical protein
MLAVSLGLSCQAQKIEFKATVSAVKASPAKQFDSIDAMQAEFFKRFLSAPGFGLSRTVHREFQEPAPMLTLEGNIYSTVPPQLIGLENQAVAYVPNGTMTVKAELKTKELRALIRTRPLTGFESNSVTLLAAGTNFVTSPHQAKTASHEAAVEQRFVLGAIRASQDCLKCHQCDEGKLLGAFSYILTRVAPLQTNSTGNAVSGGLASR